MINKTQEDLYLEYAKVIQMTREYNEKHGVDVKPWECVRHTCWSFSSTPIFYHGPTGDFTFALTILEGKPVFVGDRLYGKTLPVEILANSGFDLNEYTWTPPTNKRTFMLNGVEFESPVKDSPYDLWIFGRKFYFESDFTKKQFGTALLIMLEQARDKE